MIKFAVVFRHSPLGSAVSREGLDALLAASAFCAEDEIAVFFLDDGVLNLLPNQQPELILQKDFIASFKLLDLYDIAQRYVCMQSLARFKLTERPLLIAAEKLDRSALLTKLQSAEKLLVF